MREIIFDTETTGLDNKSDRVIEIGGVELVNHFPSGRTFHVYINPGDTKVHPDALAVHGITDEFLKDKPSFADILEDLTTFFDGARWVAHNASFDMGFINAEFARLGRAAVPNDLVTDTLSLARRKHPMGPNSLDALCRRYGIDNSHRAKHGALLDAELLAEVYIEMSGGRQATLVLGADGRGQRGGGGENREDANIVLPARPRALTPRVSEQEQLAHADLVASLRGTVIWKKYGPST